jgi:hypothetical protein
MFRLLVIALILLASPAHATWNKASSDHFIVYGEGSAEVVRAYAEKLEKFEAVLATRTGRQTEAGANRLIIFLVNDTGQVQRQMGTKDSGVAGFYSPRLWGTIAVVPRRTGTGEYDLDSQTVLFHEYAHHFMQQNAAAAYPAWFVEGFAEYYSTTEFKSDGSVHVGIPAKHRFYGLAILPPFPVERLLIPNDRPLKPDQREAFYGWSWLLTHHLYFSTSRKGQLDTYLREFAAGMSPADAARKAFGPTAELQKGLSAYRDARRLSYIKFTGLKFAPPKVDVVTLSESQSAALPMYIRTFRPSKDEKEMDLVVADARKLAARFPAEPMVLDALAEFECDVGRLNEAQRANDAVLLAEPKNAQALMRAARIAEVRLAGKGDTAAWRAIRSLIVKANRAAPNNPYPLWAFYRWHAKSGTPVTPTAIDGLRRALELAPQVAELRFALAQQAFRDGNDAAARDVLLPLLNDPHSAELRAAAQAMLDAKGKLAMPSGDKDEQEPDPK